MIKNKKNNIKDIAKFNLEITEETAGIPVKKLVKTTWGLSSRLMTKLKKNNLIFVNGRPVKGWKECVPGDLVSVLLPEERSGFEPADIPIYPAYEDDDILIINKQPGVTVHPTKGHPDNTIANGLMKYMDDTGQSFKIRFVNRLDRDTSGLLIIGKNSHAQDGIIKQMQDGTIEKRYIAIASGRIDEDMVIDLPIGRPFDGCVRRAVVKGENGYPSLTRCKVLENFNDQYTLVELKLETGRTHQIRVHMAHIGHPLAGDELYEGPCNRFSGRQALHSYMLKLKHPVTGEMLHIQSPLPDDMQRFVDQLRKEK